MSFTVNVLLFLSIINSKSIMKIANAEIQMLFHFSREGDEEEAT